MMRALTIRQPWADLIMSGMKDVENRSWPVPSTIPQWMECSTCGQRAKEGDTGLEWCDDNRRCRWTETWEQFPFTLAVHAGLRFAEGWFADGGYTDDDPMRLVPVDVDVPIEFADWVPQDRIGVILGTVDVTDCHWANWNDDPCVVCESRWADTGVWHWTLSDPITLTEPIPAKGQQRLWTLDDDVAVRVREAA